MQYHNVLHYFIFSSPFTLSHSSSVQVFVLLHQLQTFSMGRILPDQPPINSPDHSYGNVHAKTAGIDALGPKPGTELSLGQFSLWLSSDNSAKKTGLRSLFFFRSCILLQRP